MHHDNYAGFSSENTLSVHTTGRALSHSLRSFSSQQRSILKGEGPSPFSPSQRPRTQLARLVVPPTLSQEMLLSEGPSPHSSPVLRPSPVRKPKPKRPFDASLSVAVAVAYASFIFCRSFFTITQAKMKDDPTIGLTAVKANEIIAGSNACGWQGHVDYDVFLSAVVS
jgi:hypothetical protein